MDEKKNWGRVIRGELYERWPKDENGEPEEPAWLCNCANLNMGDELTINMLEAYGIPENIPRRRRVWPPCARHERTRHGCARPAEHAGGREGASQRRGRDT